MSGPVKNSAKRIWHPHPDCSVSVEYFKQEYELLIDVAQAAISKHNTNWKVVQWILACGNKANSILGKVLRVNKATNVDVERILQIKSSLSSLL